MLQALQPIVQPNGPRPLLLILRKGAWHSSGLILTCKLMLLLFFSVLYLLFCFRYEGNPLPKNPHAGRKVIGSPVGPVPIIVLYGVTDEGLRCRILHYINKFRPILTCNPSSICAHVHGFTPYFYCQVPRGYDNSKV
jgi:hypothetical protein